LQFLFEICEESLQIAKTLWDLQRLFAICKDPLQIANFLCKLQNPFANCKGSLGNPSVLTFLISLHPTLRQCHFAIFKGTSGIIANLTTVFVICKESLQIAKERRGVIGKLHSIPNEPLQIAKEFCNFANTFAICKESLQIAKSLCNLQRVFANCKGSLQIPKTLCELQR